MNDRFDIVVVGGGTAGCVLAARLSEDPARTVCLLEAGPDYGAFAAGRWPDAMLDPRRLVFTHDWGTGGEDDRSLGACVIGGSSAHNVCVAVHGSPADYDEWGPEWSYDLFAPCLERVAQTLRTADVNTDHPAPFHDAFLAAARAAGFAMLDDPNDPGQPVGVARFPANVVDGVRWNAAFAYLDPARDRPNLTIRGSSLVDRVVFEGTRAARVVVSNGEHINAECIVLASGAYFTPAILLRSGVGPPDDLRSLGIEVVADLPVGAVLLDHHGTAAAWEPSDRLSVETVGHEAAHGPLFEPHTLLKAASTSCPAGSWDLHLLPWLTPVTGQPGRFDPTVAVFHMKPLSAGRLRLVSTAPAALPLVERGFLTYPGDLDVIAEGIALARDLAATEPLRSLLGAESRPGAKAVEEYIRATARNYFHPAGTCAIGSVVDQHGGVLGLDGLVIADASVMPTVPRANTNVSTAAVAERIAETLSVARFARSG